MDFTFLDELNTPFFEFSLRSNNPPVFGFYPPIGSQPHPERLNLEHLDEIFETKERLLDGILCVAHCLSGHSRTGQVILGHKGTRERFLQLYDTYAEDTLLNLLLASEVFNEVIESQSYFSAPHRRLERLWLDFSTGSPVKGIHPDPSSAPSRLWKDLVEARDLAKARAREDLVVSVSARSYYGDDLAAALAIAFTRKTNGNKSLLVMPRVVHAALMQRGFTPRLSAALDPDPALIETVVALWDSCFEENYGMLKSLLETAVELT